MLASIRDMKKLLDDSERNAASEGRLALVEGEDVRRYCNLAFALGLDFDQELPWAAEVLADAELAPAERVDGLCLLAEDELDVEDELPVEVEVRA